MVKGKSMSKIINEAKAKKYIKEFAANHRPKYTRVSQGMLDHLDWHIRAHIQKHVLAYTGPGKTIYGPGEGIAPRVLNRFVREHVFNSVTGICKFCGNSDAEPDIKNILCNRRKV
jgi:hypothetical protein